MNFIDLRTTIRASTSRRVAITRILDHFFRELSPYL